jgi:hypothetical protein
MKKLYFLIAASMFSMLQLTVFSQGTSMNTTGAAADTSAILDISSTSKGILIPRMTAAQKGAIALPKNGLLIYQTDGVSGFWYYNGAAWVQAIGPSGATGPTGLLSAGSLAGNTPYWDGANWNVSSSNIFNDGGYIGIGTTSPLDRLHISNGGLLVENGAGQQSISLSSGNIISNDLSSGTSCYRTSIDGSLVWGTGKSLTIDNDYHITNYPDSRYYDLTILNSNGNIGIGTGTPTAKLEIAGQIKITGGSPGANKVLTSNADGLASWASPSGGNCFSNWQVFTTPGTPIFVVPTGVTTIKVCVWGGGGGGGGGDIIGGMTYTPISGGGAGGYAEGIFTEIPGTSCSLAIGTGGAENTDGTQSSFSDGVNSMISYGGQGGHHSMGRGGQGGSSTGGYLNIRGGNGGYGGTYDESYYGDRSGQTGQDGGGIAGHGYDVNYRGGGGGGGIGGGDGADGGRNDTNDGGNGGFGAGGGGGGGGTSTTHGGTGGDGRVIIFW